VSAQQPRSDGWEWSTLHIRAGKDLQVSSIPCSVTTTRHRDDFASALGVSQMSHSHTPSLLPSPHSVLLGCPKACSSSFTWCNYVASNHLFNVGQPQRVQQVTLAKTHNAETRRPNNIPSGVSPLIRREGKLPHESWLTAHLATYPSCVERLVTQGSSSVQRPDQWPLATQCTDLQATEFCSPHICRYHEAAHCPAA
jgi:hypothetical protein